MILTRLEWLKKFATENRLYLAIDLYQDGFRVLEKVQPITALSPRLLTESWNDKLSDEIIKSYPVWKQRKTGTPIRIKDMDDKHLLNSVAVCLRLDNRYTFDTERMQSFYFMTREVARRKLHKKLQEKINVQAKP